MLKIVAVFLLLSCLVAFITRSRQLRLGLWTVFGLIVVYAALKATGVMEAIAPARDGVF